MCIGVYLGWAVKSVQQWAGNGFLYVRLRLSMGGRLYDKKSLGDRALDGCFEGDMRWCLYNQQVPRWFK